MRPLVDHWSLAVRHPANVEAFRHRLYDLTCANPGGFYQLEPYDIEHAAGCCEKAPPVWALVEKVLPFWLGLEFWDGAPVVVIERRLRRLLCCEPWPVTEADETPPARRRGTQQLLEAITARHQTIVAQQRRQDRRDRRGECQ